MTVTYVGELSIGAAVPGAVTALNLALPDLQARLASLVAFLPVNVDFAAQLVLAQQIVTSIQASITLGITPPSIAFQIAAVAALIAELEASVSAIADFTDLLAAAGLHVYAYAGDTDQLGTEMDTELAGGVPGGGPTDAANALILITTVGATWTAMGGVFQVSP